MQLALSLDVKCYCLYNNTNVNFCSSVPQYTPPTVNNLTIVEGKKSCWYAIKKQISKNITIINKLNITVNINVVKHKENSNQRSKKKLQYFKKYDSSVQFLQHYSF